MATTISSITATLRHLRSKTLFSYIKNPKTFTISLQNILNSMRSTKNQLRFHATLIRRRSQPFLFFLENYKGAPHFKHWKRFNPYRKHCLRILLAVFEGAITEVERDEEVVAGLLRNPFGKSVLGVLKNGRGAEDVVLRWSIGVKNRWLGRLILDSWKQETDADGEPQGLASCSIKDVVHLMAAVWEEEAEKIYFHVGVPEEPGPRPIGGNDGESRTQKEYAEEGVQEEEEEFEAWRPFKGPPCLKRKDALHLVYRD
ncbi:hypothetical protein TWF788_007986 [Orbilia oligospora]|uniref:Uncharacterized protein n=1 Tax=Orbilia oligospora TaxID=2813651 RepID=A0A7C8KJ93_ORBOL|nr:hypothetical protein TWF788_007986 [Orbilia oligospora]